MQEVPIFKKYQSGEVPVPDNPRQFLLIFPLVLMLVLAGGEGVRLLGFDAGQAWASGAANEDEDVPATGPFYIGLEPISVPIREKKKVSHYVFLSLSLEVQDSGESERVQRFRPKLRDAFIRELHARTVLSKVGDGTLDFDGIKKRLMRQSEEILGKGIVSDVLITHAISGFG